MKKNKPMPPPSKEFLSTGEAAALCSVTPDTVLKWIQAGKITATRTPGGHHRIPRAALQPVFDRTRPVQAPDEIDGSFQYCWEFHSKGGKLSDGCRECIVFRSGTKRCYEMTSLPAQSGYVGLFCKGTCEECEYYDKVLGQRPNVLVLTDRRNLRNQLKSERHTLAYNLKVAECEYRCSMYIEKFRPDYVFIDCTMGAKKSREYSQLLYEDPRIPFVRVVLVGSQTELPDRCDRLVFATVEDKLSSDTISQLIGRSQFRHKDLH